MNESQNFYFIVPNKDLNQIKTPMDAVDLIENGLDNLALASSITDINNTFERKNFLTNVNYLKRFYERLERLILDERDVR